MSTDANVSPKRFTVFVKDVGHGSQRYVPVSVATSSPTVFELHNAVIAEFNWQGQRKDDVNLFFVSKKELGKQKPSAQQESTALSTSPLDLLDSLEDAKVTDGCFVLAECTRVTVSLGARAPYHDESKPVRGSSSAGSQSRTKTAPERSPRSRSPASIFCEVMCGLMAFLVIVAYVLYVKRQWAVPQIQREEVAHFFHHPFKAGPLAMRPLVGKCFDVAWGAGSLYRVCGYDRVVRIETNAVSASASSTTATASAHVIGWWTGKWITTVEGSETKYLGQLYEDGEDGTRTSVIFRCAADFADRSVVEVGMYTTGWYKIVVSVKEWCQVVKEGRSSNATVDVPPSSVPSASEQPPASATPSTSPVLPSASQPAASVTPSTSLLPSASQLPPSVTPSTSLLPSASSSTSMVPAVSLVPTATALSGPQGMRPMLGQPCFLMPDGHGFVFELCWYVSVRQLELYNHGSYTAGQWAGTWMTVQEEGVTKYSGQLYEGGDLCGSTPRKTSVFFVCDPTDDLPQQIEVGSMGGGCWYKLVVGLKEWCQVVADGMAAAPEKPLPPSPSHKPTPTSIPGPQNLRPLLGDCFYVFPNDGFSFQICAFNKIVHVEISTTYLHTTGVWTGQWITKDEGGVTKYAGQLYENGDDGQKTSVFFKCAEGAADRTLLDHGTMADGWFRLVVGIKEWCELVKEGTAATS